MYAYNFGSVNAARFGILIALALIAFAYIGGMTMVSGAVIAGLVVTEGLFPHIFDEWARDSGTGPCSSPARSLIITLIVNPDGIAGSDYRKKQLKRKRPRRSRRSRSG